MSFLTVGARLSQSFLGSTTSHPVDMPATVLPRRGLAIFFYSGTPTVTTPSGWTAKNPAGGWNNGGTARTYLFVKRTNGSEGGTSVDCVTSSNGLAVSVTYYFTDDNFIVDACISAQGAATTGTGTTPNAASLTTGWGSQDFLAITGFGATTGIVSAFPAGYSNGQAPAGLPLGTAEKQVTAASEDAGAFTIGTSANWAAFTVAFRVPQVVDITAISDDTLADGQTGVVLTGTGFSASANVVELGDNADYDLATKVGQTETAEGVTSETFTVVKGALAYGTVYAFLTNSSGFRSAGFPAILLEPEPSLLNAAIFSAPMDAILYNSSDVQIGGIVDLLEVHINEEVEGIPTTTFKAPLMSQGISLATGGTRIQIRRIGEGVLFAGKIEHRSDPIDENGVTVVEFTCFDYAIELLRKQTWRSKLQLQLSAQDAIDDILDGTAFTGTITGAYDAVTKEYINQNLIRSLTDLRSVLNAYWRKIPVVREIEIKNYSSPSGIVLSNLQMLNSNSQIGAMRTIQSYETDVSAVVNRLGLEIKTDSSRIMTLQEASVDVPYVRQSELIRPARFIDGFASISNTDKFSTSFRTLGENRFSLATTILTGMDENSPAGLGGQFLDNLLFDDAGGNAVSVWGGVPPKGKPQLSFPPNTAASTTTAAVASFENVDQISPIRDSELAVGSSTTASGSVTAEVGDLIFAFLIMRDITGATVTPLDGQVRVGELNNLGSAVDPDLTTLWTLPATAGTNTLEWTISPTQDWLVAIFALKPAKNWYIEDVASQALYGIIEDVVTFDSFAELELDNERIANSAYYALVKILKEQKDPPKFIQPEVTYLPGSPLDWNVGDTLHLINQSSLLPINDRWIVVKRTHHYDSQGVRTWDLTLSNKTLLPLDAEAMLRKALEKIASTQSNQV